MSAPFDDCECLECRRARAGVAFDPPADVAVPSLAGKGDGGSLRDSKPTNPKDAVGIRKVPMSVLPLAPLMEAGLGMLEGAREYGRHNYRVAGVRASVYFDALQRHIGAWWEGEDIDAKSGLSHVTKAICCLLVLRDSMIQGNWSDDRPPVTPAGWIENLNRLASEIIDRKPNPMPAHVAKDAA